MKWQRGHRSNDVEVRRGGMGGGGAGPMAGLAIGMLMRRFGWKGALFGIAALFLISRFMGGGGGGPSSVVAPDQQATAPVNDERVEFVSFVLDDVQNTWTNIFAASGSQYPRA